VNPKTKSHHTGVDTHGVQLDDSLDPFSLLLPGMHGT
jgi:hypothetical protein